MTRFIRGGEPPKREYKDNIPVYHYEEPQAKEWMEPGSLVHSAMVRARKESIPITIGQPAYIWFPEDKEYIYHHETVSWDPLQKITIISNPTSDIALTTWDEFNHNTSELESADQVQGYYFDIFLNPEQL